MQRKTMYVIEWGTYDNSEVVEVWDRESKAQSRTATLNATVDNGSYSYKALVLNQESTGATDPLAHKFNV